MGPLARTAVALLALLAPSLAAAECLTVGDQTICRGSDDLSNQNFSGGDSSGNTFDTGPGSSGSSSGSGDSGGGVSSDCESFVSNNADAAAVCEQNLVNVIQGSTACDGTCKGFLRAAPDGCIEQLREYLNGIATQQGITGTYKVCGETLVSIRGSGGGGGGGSGAATAGGSSAAGAAGPRAAALAAAALGAAALGALL